MFILFQHEENRSLSTRRDGPWRLPRPRPSLPSDSSPSWRCTAECSTDACGSRPAAEPGKPSGAWSALARNRGWVGKKEPTLDNSSPVMHPMTSVLFANTRRLAPESRCSSQGSLAAGTTPPSIDSVVNPPPPGAGRAAPPGSRPRAAGRWRRRPR